MKIITYKEFCEFVHKKITNDPQAEKIIRRYMLTYFDGGPGEYVKPFIEGAALLGSCIGSCSYNLFIPSQNIYISLKKLTVLTLACICDIFVTRGAVTALGVALGKIGPCIYKLEEGNCCVFAKILFYNTISEDVDFNKLLNEYTEKCTGLQNPRCVFCKNPGVCTIQEADIYISQLIN